MPASEQLTPESFERAHKILAESLQNDKDPEVDPDRTVTMGFRFHRKDGSVACLPWSPVQADGRRITYALDGGTPSAGELVRRLAEVAALRDISVLEPDIEDVVARLYQEMGGLERASQAPRARRAPGNPGHSAGG